MGRIQKEDWTNDLQKENIMTIEKTIVLKVDADNADAELKKVTESVDGLADGIEDVGKEAEESVKSTKKLTKVLGGAGKAMRGIGTAMKAAGIGLIVALFAKLAEILGKNQKVMDLFSSAMTTIEIAFKDLFDFVTSNFLPAVQKVKDFFENLTFDKIKKAIKENLIERFESLLEVVGFVGKAIKQFFEGDFKGALETAKEAGKEMIDVYTGVDDTVGKVKETVTKAAESIKNYAVETFTAAKAITELNNQALIAESVNRGLIEQYDRQAEQLRQIRDDDMRLIEDRIEANNKLAEVLNEQEKLMLRNADIAIQAAQNQVALNNNIENQIALQDALNEKAGIQAQIEGFRSEQLVNQNSLIRERAELENEYFDDIDAMMEADMKESDENSKRETEKLAEQADEATKIEEAKENAKQELAGKTFQLIGMMAKEGSALAKGVAVAEAIRNTYQGVTSALSAPTVIPDPAGAAFRFANAAAVGVMGALNVKKILSTGTTSKGGGSAGGGGGRAPSFNLVRGTGTNQITEGLKKENAPVKSYVVSSDVSTSQELDRKIVEGASL